MYNRAPICVGLEWCSSIFSELLQPARSQSSMESSTSDSLMNSNFTIFFSSEIRKYMTYPPSMSYFTRGSQYVLLCTLCRAVVHNSHTITCPAYSSSLNYLQDAAFTVKYSELMVDSSPMCTGHLLSNRDCSIQHASLELFHWSIPRICSGPSVFINSP